MRGAYAGLGIPPEQGRAVLLAAAVAGSLDLLYAVVIWSWRGVPAASVMQGVASGLLGEAAFSGGAPSALFGFALHYGMMLVIAGVFVAAFARARLSRARAAAYGIAYGVAVYVVMNWVVLPISNFPDPVRRVSWADLAVHIFFVGAPIGLAAARSGTRTASSASESPIQQGEMQ